MTKRAKGQGRIHKPWPQSEKDRLKQLINDGVMPLGCVDLFPSRSPTAVMSMYKEVKYQVIRQKNGDGYEGPGKLVLPMLDPNDPGQSCSYQKDWTDKAIESNKNFLEAMARIGRAA